MSFESFLTALELFDLASVTACLIEATAEDWLQDFHRLHFEPLHKSLVDLIKLQDVSRSDQACTFLNFWDNLGLLGVKITTVLGCILLSFLPVASRWLTIAFIASLVREVLIQHFASQERRCPNRQDWHEKKRHGIIQTSDVSKVLQDCVDLAFVRNVDVRSSKCDIETEFMIRLEIVLDFLSLFKSQKVVRLDVEWVKDGPLIVHELSSIRRKLCFCHEIVVPPHVAVVLKDIPCQCLDGCIWVFFAVLKEVTHYVYIYSRFVKVAVEFIDFSAVTSSLVVASFKLQDDYTFCVTVSDSTRDTNICRVKTDWILSDQLKTFSSFTG